MDGVLYTAIGKRHYEQALVSAESVRARMDLPITLMTNHLVINDDTFDNRIFVDVDEYTPKCKIMAATTSPYDRTLMLDTDTYMVGVVNLDVLDRFDIAAVFQPNRVSWHTIRPVPREFPEFNSGVLIFKKCDVVGALCDDWLASWETLPQRGDQGALREALYYSNARLCVLPPEYNYRFANDTLVSGAVRILHGPGDVGRYEGIRRRANTHGGQRILRAVDVLSR